jgi:hypothetical protein
MTYDLSPEIWEYDLSPRVLVTNVHRAKPEGSTSVENLVDELGMQSWER